MIHKFMVSEYENHPYGFKYNVQLWHSTDNGSSWNYCGVGRFCKTMEEVINYIKNY